MGLFEMLNEIFSILKEVSVAFVSEAKLGLTFFLMTPFYMLNEGCRSRRDNFSTDKNK